MYLPDLGEAFADAYERCGIDPSSLTASHFVTARRTLAQLFVLLKSEGIAEHQISYWSADLTTNEGAITLPSDTIDITDLVLRVDDVDRPLTRISKERWLAISSKETLSAPAEYWISHEWASDVAPSWMETGSFLPALTGRQRRPIQGPGRGQRWFSIPSRRRLDTRSTAIGFARQKTRPRRLIFFPCAKPGARQSSPGSRR